MEVVLTQTIPSEDGYYLMKFNKTSGLHLILIQTELDGQRVIIPQIHQKKQLTIHINDGHGPLLREAFFSEKPIFVTLV